MATTIKLKNSVTTTNAPSSLVQGEVAINITDKKVWVGNAATTPIQLLGAGASGTFGALTCTSLTNSGLTSGRVTYASTGGLLADSANFTFNGTTVTMANDASISGLTVGKGGGAVSTNTAIGVDALKVNEAGGNNNTAVGYQAADSNTTGDNNVAVGSQTLQANTTANNNTAVGYQALYTNTTAVESTAVGQQALYTNNGYQNTAVGRQSAYSTTTGQQNVAMGGISLYSNTTGSYNVAIGRDALSANTTADNNTAVGYQAGYSNTAEEITAFGAASLYSNTTGTNNIAVGRASLFSNTTGSSNTGLGRQALFSNTTASNNTAVGYQAGYTGTTAAKCTYIGTQAGYSCSDTGDVHNTAIGFQAGYTMGVAFYNTFVGSTAGYSVTTGNNNTFVGYASGTSMTTGSKNTILGRYTGNNGGLDIRTASNYIVLSDGDGNPRFRMDNNGYPFFSNMPAGAGTYPLKYNTTTGAVTADTSSRLYKSNIESSPYGLNEVLKLQSRKYKRIDDNSVEIGLIADEVYEVMPEFVPMISKSFVTGNAEDTEIIAGGVNYDKLTSVLVKAIQELKAEVDSLKAQLNK
jgi:hypothetical protein